MAPWADHTRIASGHLWWYVQPFLSITVVQIFFLGSLFFCVAALTRKIFIVYLQGVALFMIYLIGITVFSATRSLEHFWSAILDPVGLMLSDSVTRYWTVIEKNTLLFPWSGVFLINRLLWVGIGCAALGVVWALFPMSVEALTGKISGRRAARAKLSEDDDVRPIRSLVAAKLPKVGQEFGPATSWAQLTSLTKVRISYMLHEIPFWAICVLLVAFAINNGYWAGKIGGVNFVTAHELGHQWWGHQLIGGQVIGSNMMSETLAEYSALEVMEKKYGADNMHKFLKHELDRYLRGRAGEIRKEPPLALVQREGYVWYQKGGLVMYTLANYIGEDRVNTALKNFLQHYGYANANDARSGPYPDTRQFVAALREQTPADMQYLITDMFENIVLYDNKALTATVAPTADKKFNVTLTVQARKSKADENGNETAMPLNDYVDIGVFTGKKDHEKPLYLKKEKLTQEKQTFSVVVDQMPTRAGIDPYNKLVDRVAEDNIIDVTQR